MHSDGTIEDDVLTPAFRVDCDFRDDRQRNFLAKFVRALRLAWERLKDFYAKPTDSYPIPGEPVARWFPYANKYTHRSRRTKHAFEYKARMIPDGLVFRAVLVGNNDGKEEEIVVKFTRTYSSDVHELLEQGGFAPKLLAIEEIPGGWMMVVMEYLRDWVMLGSKLNDERQKYRKKLKEAVSKIHEKDFVHGDIRGANVLVRDVEYEPGVDVKIIDFDHCGVHKQDRYPREWNHHMRQEDCKEGDVMLKRHDIFLMGRLFDNLAKTKERAIHHKKVTDEKFQNLY